MSRALLADCALRPFGKHSDHGLVECGAAAVAELRDRHPALSTVDSLWVGSARPGESDGWESGLAVAIAQSAGLGGCAATDVHAFCASANVAFINAVREVRAGLADVAVVVGVEHMSRYPGRGPLVPPAMAPWAGILSPPVFYALCASRYVHDHGPPAGALADISVRNRGFATANPAARFRTPVTRDEVLGSRMVSDPLTLLQCSAPADGGGAALVVSDAGARRLGLSARDCAEVLGVGHVSAPTPDRLALTSFVEDVAAAARAYAESGVDPADIDVAEVHDAFTVSQAIHLEDLGLAKPGEGWADTGRLVVNPGGGLLGRGHPLGATGIAQLDAVLRVLRAGDARLGLVQEAGGLQHLGQLLSTVVVLGGSGKGQP